MYVLKQSTALTVPFFVHDAAGDAVTGLTNASFTKRISKNGGAFAAMTVTITEMENGFYSIPLSAAHSDTNGLLTVVFTNAGAKQVNLQWRVETRILDDLAFPTTSGRSLDVTATGEAGIDLDNVNGTLDAGDIGADAITEAKIADNAIAAEHIAANAIGASELATDAIGAAQLASDAIDEIVDQVWNELKAGHVGVGSFGEEVQLHALSSEIAALNDLSQAQILNDATPFAGGDIDAAISSRAIAGDAMALTAAAIDAIWDELQAGHVGAGSFGLLLDATISSRAIAGDAMDLVANALDAAALALDAGQEIADRILARSIASGADGGRTIQDALRAIRNRRAIAAGTLTVYEEDDATPAWTGAVTTAAGNPINEIDPA